MQVYFVIVNVEIGTSTVKCMVVHFIAYVRCCLRPIYVLKVIYQNTIFVKLSFYLI